MLMRKRDGLAGDFHSASTLYKKVLSGFPDILKVSVQKVQVDLLIPGLNS